MRPGGENIPVTLDNLDDFLDQVGVCIGFFGFRVGSGLMGLRIPLSVLNGLGVWVSGAVWGLASPFEQLYMMLHKL